VTVIAPAGSLLGHIAVPGDKSISHRAVLIGSVCEGEVRITGFGRSRDTEATVRAMRALGVDVLEEDIDVLRIRGAGLRGLREPREPIDCGNAGTLLRLLAGLLAGQQGRFELAGDESLNARPVDRVAEPLERMGGKVETREGFPPLVIEGSSLHGIEYELPVASAQVKSCILMAGLLASGRTSVVEPVPTRDHTEIMLEAAGAPIARAPHRVTVEATDRLRLDEVVVPGDISAAAPFVLAATLLPGSELYVHGVGLNPRRTGFLDVLGRMGARITVFNRRKVGGEQVGDLDVRSAPLIAATVSAQEVPLLVDELPLLALAAGFARGESVVQGAQELRVKETDRLEAVTTSLRALGVRVAATDDGFRVRGVPSRPKGGGMDSQGDHRLAMLAAVAGLVSREGVEVGEPQAVAVSFPGFYELLDSVAQRS
jgi:3-phosphoshikimate 1-carboxyvinyltransferase